MPQQTGGCLCGAVRYTTTATPLMTFVCHCRSCQKFTGSAFGTVVVFPKDTVTFSGTMKTFTSPAAAACPFVGIPPGMRFVDRQVGGGPRAGPSYIEHRHV